MGNFPFDGDVYEKVCLTKSVFTLLRVNTTITKMATEFLPCEK